MTFPFPFSFSFSTTLQSLFYPLLFSILLYLHSRRHHQSTKKPSTPGLKSYPIIGHLPHFIRNGHRFLAWTTETTLQTPNHTMGFSGIGSTNGILITANPANVEHVLRINSGNYPKGERSTSMMEDFLGHGIFNSDGEDWKWQRKTASYEFNKKSLRNFVVEAVDFEVLNRLLPVLNRAAETGSKVELQDVLEKFAFDNICKVIIGEDPACLTEEEDDEEEVFKGTVSSKKFMKAFTDAGDLATARFFEPFDGVWKMKKFLNIGSERRLKEALSVVHEYVTNIIRSRMSKGIELDGREDMLSRFASNKDHNEVFLMDAVTNFLLAGRETTSTALTWFFWLVSTRPDIEKKIVDEIKRVRASNKIATETFGFDALRDMNYLHAAITESMRLYPPIPMDTISCKADDVMPDGTFVGQGWFVMYSAYAMGRSEEIWGKDCLDFKPERWLDGNGVFKPESPFRYPVFHAGPRMCLGKEMAYIQMKSFAACVLERFHLTTLGKEGTPEHVLSVTLRMKGGLPVQLKKRENY